MKPGQKKAGNRELPALTSLLAPWKVKDQQGLLSKACTPETIIPGTETQAIRWL